MKNTSEKNLTRGASVMVASVTLAKVLGVLYIIPLTPLIGAVGLGIYQNAYALYIILLTLATSGFPTAMGKLIAERLALHKYGEVEQIYKVTMRSVFVFAILAALVTWFGAPLYSHFVALGASSKTASDYIVPSVRALVPSVLIVPLMSGLRGYLQGFQRLEPSAYSQTVEQLFRIIAMLVGAYIVYKSHQGVAAGAAAATFGSFVGAVAGFALLVFAVLPIRKKVQNRTRGQRVTLTSKQAFRLIVQVALPVCLGALVVPISGLVDSLTVQNLLMVTGKSFHDASSEFGILSRQAFTLIQLPLAFAMAIGASILPAVSEARALKDQRSLQRNITGTLRSMFFITFPTAVTLLVLARPIDYLLFKSYEGAGIISSVSFMGIFSGMELISTYILQGLGKMYRPVRNMMIGVCIKLVFNVALILPFGIMGAAVATTIGYLFSSALNVMAVKKYSNTRFSTVRLAVPSLLASLIVLFVMGFVGSGVGYALSGITGPDSRILSALQLLLAVGIGGISYVVLAIRFYAVSAEELRSLPAIGRRLYRLALRIQPDQPEANRRSR